METSGLLVFDDAGAFLGGLEFQTLRSLIGSSLSYLLVLILCTKLNILK